jgi:hypothetical protein
MCCTEKTGSSAVGLNNFGEMLQPVSEYVELCQPEWSVAVTLTSVVPSDQLCSCLLSGK